MLLAHTATVPRSLQSLRVQKQNESLVPVQRNRIEMNYPNQVLYYKPAMIASNDLTAKEL